MTSREDMIFDFRIDAQWVACVDDQNRVLKEHSVLVKDGVIEAILPHHEATKFIVETEYRLEEHILIPGLVNAHGHAAMTLFRGLANDIPLNTWLQEHIWPAEGKWVNDEFVRAGARLAITEMLRGGTTCFSDMYFFPEIVAEEVVRSGIKAQLCCPILDFPTIWGEGPEEYISKTMALHAQYVDSDQVSVAFGPHAPYTVSDAPIEEIVKLAGQHQIPVQMHVHETQQEVEDALSTSGQRPISRLKELGLFGLENFQCVHMTSLVDDEITLLQSSGACVIHCPESNMKLASGFAPVQTLLDNNVCVALGTDGAASNNDLDMFGEMRTAAFIAKGHTGNASAVNAQSALRMATINGAKALGMDAHIGSIESGKSADLCAISIDALNTVPVYDPVASLVYNTNASQVSHVWAKGKLLVEDKKLRDFDLDDTLSRAREWASRISREV